MLIIQCEYCHKEFECYPKRFTTSKHHCCSKDCINKLRKLINSQAPGYLNCECAVCGKKFHIKESHKKRFPTHCCSPECTKIAQRQRMTGARNHQYGLKGKLNASWQGGTTQSYWGYRLISVPDHPFANIDGHVFEHRLVAEQFLLNDENSVVIGGKRYLSPDYVVHHIDENRLNNDVSNLQVMTKGEHQSLHNKKQNRERDSLGRFMAK